MTQVIVTGFDGSDEATRAATWAATLANATGSELHLVAVVQPPDVAEDVETTALIHRLRRQHKTRLDEMRVRLKDHTERLTCHVLVGHPADQLIRFAAEHHADLLVVGHRSRGALQRWLSGSVARHLVDHAPCALTVVR